MERHCTGLRMLYRDAFRPLPAKAKGRKELVSAAVIVTMTIPPHPHAITMTATPHPHTFAIAYIHSVLQHTQILYNVYCILNTVY